ncbi:alpha/beta hydrolase [Sphingosinicella sp. LHD-64]|uniref:alpha/beta hydrolase family protein n=1 Tax=Sphingosinicella sp. LHD-64 TaxID=3072139 RepID=UPI00280D96CB|nr:alpha/beta hydrolase [Sphingosinicella sp. LHD-64]MDQ8756863.1 alpha/beta hydrolase [Sphingosinicella sp. LHD-64]
MRLGILIGLLLATASFERDAYAETLSLERADGSRIVYHLAGPPRRGRAPILIMFQGSGCDSVARNDRIPWMAARLAPNHVVLTVEKYGVAAGADGESCVADYWRGNSLSQRVTDAAHVIAQLRQARWWNGQLVIFGGSEGGAVAAMLAPLIPETRAVIVWSSGIGLPIGTMIRSALPPQMQAEADRVFLDARANPAADRQWGGASYRWWADALDMVPARSLAQTRVPVLLVHGTRDQSAPIASARAARDLVVGAGKANFTFREYEGYDHFMIDAEGVDHRVEVLAAIATWLRHLPR